MQSQLTKKQTKTIKGTLNNDDRIVAAISYDDDCGNGHNSFAITCDIYEPGQRRP